MKTQSLAGKWQFRQAGSSEWLPATVPGGVHTDLLALNRIPNPFVGDNEWRVKWVAESDWAYRYQFDVAAEVFDRLIPVLQEYYLTVYNHVMAEYDVVTIQSVNPREPTSRRGRKSAVGPTVGAKSLV